MVSKTPSAVNVIPFCIIGGDNDTMGVAASKCANSSVGIFCRAARSKC